MDSINKMPNPGEGGSRWTMRRRKSVAFRAGREPNGDDSSSTSSSSSAEGQHSPKRHHGEYLRALLVREYVSWSRRIRYF